MHSRSECTLVIERVDAGVGELWPHLKLLCDELVWDGTRLECTWAVLLYSPAAGDRCPLFATLIVVAACASPAPPTSLRDSAPSADSKFDNHEPVDAGLDNSSSLYDAGVHDMGDAMDALAPVDAGSSMLTDASPPPSTGELRYPVGRTHSPIPASLAEHWQSLVRGRTDAFIKVGDSITATTSFMSCFDTSFDLGGPDLEATHEHFRGSGSYARVSEAAQSGRTAQWCAGGPVQSELMSVAPGYGVVMFGTNDIGWGIRGLEDWFGTNLLAVIDSIVAAGALPLVMSIPPRDDNSSLNRLVPRFNDIIRGIAQGRQIPFVDFHRELALLPSHGLSGDGVHPNTAPSGACDLSASGLRFGNNVRNRLALQGLDRMRRAVEDGIGFDPEGQRVSGLGTHASPYTLDTLPFTHMSTTVGGESLIHTYGCASSNEGGPERVYAIDLSAPTTLEALVIDSGDVDVDVHIVGGAATPDGTQCHARGHQIAATSLPAGRHFVVVDSFVRGTGVPAAGEYLLVIREP